MLHIIRPEGEETLTTFGESEPLLRDLDPSDMRSGPGAARDLFDGFDPVTRPVLWRVLVIQVLLYWCFQNVVFGEGLPGLDDLENAFRDSAMHASLAAALQSRPDAEAAEDLSITIKVAVSYFVDRLTPAYGECRRCPPPTRHLPPHNSECSLNWDPKVTVPSSRLQVVLVRGRQPSAQPRRSGVDPLRPR